MRLSDLLTAIDAEIQRAEAFARDDAARTWERVSQTQVAKTSLILSRLTLWIREAMFIEIRGPRLVTLYEATRTPRNQRGHVVLGVKFGGGPLDFSHALPSLNCLWMRGFDLGCAGSGTSELALAILSHHLHVAASDRTEFEALLAKANPAARRAWHAHAKLAAKLADGSADSAIFSNTDLDALLDSVRTGY